MGVQWNGSCATAGLRRLAEIEAGCRPELSSWTIVSTSSAWSIRESIRVGRLVWRVFHASISGRAGHNTGRFTPYMSATTVWSSLDPFSNLPDQTSHPATLIPFPVLVPTRATLPTFSCQPWVYELMHHAKVPSAIVTSPEVQKV